jgi:hypothetical protein
LLPFLALSFSGFLLPGTSHKVFTFGQPFMRGEVATLLWLVIVGAKDRKSMATVA